MARTDEMRRVMAHAAEKLRDARDGKGHDHDRLRRLEIANAYAGGVRELLGTYLQVTDDEPAPAASAQSGSVPPAECPKCRVLEPCEDHPAGMAVTDP